MTRKGTLECLFHCDVCAPHPILSLELVDVAGGAASDCGADCGAERVAVVGSTDGTLRFVDLRPLLRCLSERVGSAPTCALAESFIDATAAIVVGATEALRTMEQRVVGAARAMLESLARSRAVALYRPHSCGANCAAAVAVSSSGIVVLSGGDDQALVATAIDLRGEANNGIMGEGGGRGDVGGSKGASTTTFATLASRCDVAGSSLKGLCVLRAEAGSLLAVAVGTEQRLHLFRVRLDGASTTIEVIDTFDVDVADISSIAVARSGVAGGRTAPSCDVAIAGTGLQIVRVPVGSYTE